MSRVVSIILLVVIVGCQKGPDDPAISLVSRKARLSGTWDLVEMRQYDGSIERVYDDGVVTITIGDTTEIKRDFEYTATFDRNGEYEITSIENVAEDTAANREAYTLTTVATGNWEFTGGNNSPNKSQLLLLRTRIERTESDQGSNVQITTTDGPNTGLVYDLIELSSENLRMSYDESVSFGGGQSIDQADYTFRKRS